MSATENSHGSITSSGAVGAASQGRREMPTAVKLLGFVLGLAAVFGAAVTVGAQVGPVGEPAAADQMGEHTDDRVSDHESGAGGAHGTGGPDASRNTGAGGSEVPGGLQVSEGGYTFVPTSTVLPAGSQTLEFVIEGPAGAAVTDYEIEHEKELHLIVVRRDFTGFQHVHPERAPDGTWTARVDLTGGTWRLFADFTPVPEDGSDAEALTLGTDLSVTGATSGFAAASPETRVDTVDGYRVELVGTLTPGAESNLSFAVTRQGDPVADLQPYLGARGHLVALREGDLAYLHVHPTDDEDGTGNEVGFAATVPSVGGYRLYLDFRVDGVVRTTSFVLRTDTRSAGESSAADDDVNGGDDAHGEDDHGH